MMNNKKSYFPDHILLASAACLLFNCSTKSPVNLFSAQQVDSVLTAQLLNTQTTYDEFILDNFKLSTTVREQANKSIRNLKLKDISDKRLLFLVSTELDCITCINDQFRQFITNLSPKGIQQHIILVTTQQNFNRIRNTWPQVLSHMNVIILSKNEVIQQFHYVSEKPVYILYDKSTDYISNAFILDQRFPQLNKQLVTYISKNLL